MRIVNAHTEAALMAQRWFAQLGNRDPRATAAVLALGQTPNPDDLDNVFAAHEISKNWKTLRSFVCHECLAEHSEVILVGEPMDFGNQSAQLCAACLVKALKLIDG